MKRLFTLSIFLLLITNLTFAQRSTGGISKESTLTVISNVHNFDLLINNNQIKGNRVKLKHGTYNIIVRANGYQDWYGTVSLNSNQTISANLIPNQHRLSVSANTNCSIYINNSMVGNNSYNGLYSPGTYTVTVRSNGFMEYRATINLDRDTNLVATLQPLMATVNVSLPQHMLNHRFGHPMDQIKVYDNGMELKGLSYQLTPGRHTIRVESGGFVMEGNYNLEAGRTYTIEPTMYISVK